MANAAVMRMDMGVVVGAGTGRPDEVDVPEIQQQVAEVVEVAKDRVFDGVQEAKANLSTTVSRITESHTVKGTKEYFSNLFSKEGVVNLAKGMVFSNALTNYTTKILSQAKLAEGVEGDTTKLQDLKLMVSELNKGGVAAWSKLAGNAMLGTAQLGVWVNPALFAPVLASGALVRAGNIANQFRKGEISPNELGVSGVAAIGTAILLEALPGGLPVQVAMRGFATSLYANISKDIYDVQNDITSSNEATEEQIQERNIFAAKRGEVYGGVMSLLIHHDTISGGVANILGGGEAQAADFSQETETTDMPEVQDPVPAEGTSENDTEVDGGERETEGEPAVDTQSTQKAETNVKRTEGETQKVVRKNESPGVSSKDNQNQVAKSADVNQPGAVPPSKAGRDTFAQSGGIDTTPAASGTEARLGQTTADDKSTDVGSNKSPSTEKSQGKDLAQRTQVGIGQRGEDTEIPDSEPVVLVPGAAESIDVHSDVVDAIYRGTEIGPLTQEGVFNTLVALGVPASRLDEGVIENIWNDLNLSNPAGAATHATLYLNSNLFDQTFSSNGDLESVSLNPEALNTAIASAEKGEQINFASLDPSMAQQHDPEPVTPASTFGGNVESILAENGITSIAEEIGTAAERIWEDAANTVENAGEIVGKFFRDLQEALGLDDNHPLNLDGNGFVEGLDGLVPVEFANMLELEDDSLVLRVDDESISQVLKELYPDQFFTEQERIDVVNHMFRDAINQIPTSELEEKLGVTIATGTTPAGDEISLDEARERYIREEGVVVPLEFLEAQGLVDAEGLNATYVVWTVDNLEDSFRPAGYYTLDINSESIDVAVDELFADGAVYSDSNQQQFLLALFGGEQLTKLNEIWTPEEAQAFFESLKDDSGNITEDSFTKAIPPTLEGKVDVLNLMAAVDTVLEANRELSMDDMSVDQARAILDSVGASSYGDRYLNDAEVAVAMSLIAGNDGIFSLSDLQAVTTDSAGSVNNEILTNALEDVFDQLISEDYFVGANGISFGNLVEGSKVGDLTGTSWAVGREFYAQNGSDLNFEVGEGGGQVAVPAPAQPGSGDPSQPNDPAAESQDPEAPPSNPQVRLTDIPVINIGGVQADLQYDATTGFVYTQDRELIEQWRYFVDSENPGQNFLVDIENARVGRISGENLVDVNPNFRIYELDPAITDGKEGVYQIINSSDGSMNSLLLDGKLLSGDDIIQGYVEVSGQSVDSISAVQQAITGNRNLLTGQALGYDEAMRELYGDNPGRIHISVGDENADVASEMKAFLELFNADTIVIDGEERALTDAELKEFAAYLNRSYSRFNPASYDITADDLRNSILGIIAPDSDVIDPDRLIEVRDNFLNERFAVFDVSHLNGIGQTIQVQEAVAQVQEVSGHQNTSLIVSDETDVPTTVQTQAFLDSIELDITGEGYTEEQLERILFELDFDGSGKLSLNDLENLEAIGIRGYIDVNKVEEIVRFATDNYSESIFGATTSRDGELVTPVEFTIIPDPLRGVPILQGRIPEFDFNKPFPGADLQETLQENRVLVSQSFRDSIGVSVATLATLGILGFRLNFNAIGIPRLKLEKGEKREWFVNRSGTNYLVSGERWTPKVLSAAYLIGEWGSPIIGSGIPAFILVAVPFVILSNDTVKANLTNPQLWLTGFGAAMKAAEAAVDIFKTVGGIGVGAVKAGWRARGGVVNSIDNMTDGGISRFTRGGSSSGSSGFTYNYSELTERGGKLYTKKGAELLPGDYDKIDYRS